MPPNFIFSLHATPLLKQSHSVAFSSREASQEFSDSWSQVEVLWFRSSAPTA